MGRPKTVKVAPAKPPAALAATSFAKIKPRLSKLQPEEVLSVNADVPTAVAVALGALPNLRPMRDAIVEELPKHPVAHLDELEDYALATWYAHLLHENQGTDTESLKKLTDEASALRETLLVAAEALAHRGLLDSKRVAEIRSGQGHKDPSSDLVTLAALFTSQWERIKTKTAVEPHEIARADELGPKLVMVMGAKEAAGPGGKPVDTADRLARAFTLLARAYDACRRAVAYVRWEQGDVDDLVPPLYKRPGGPGRKPKDAQAGSKNEASASASGAGAAGGEVAPSGNAKTAVSAADADADADAEADAEA